MSNYRIIFANEKISPYKIGPEKIRATATIFNGQKLSYLNNTTVELWLNHTGAWVKYNEFTSNNFGVITITRETSDFSDINCCLGYIKATIKVVVYTSNIARFNFIESDILWFNINAGSCSVVITDRSEYDLFDAYGRLISYDRML